MQSIENSSVTVSTVITAKWILPVEPSPETILDNHAVAIDANGIIADILPYEQAQQKYTQADWVELRNHALIPGFVNAHTHSAMTLMRGIGDDQLLSEWLHGTIWPIEMSFVAEKGFLRDGTILALAEMLKGGTTCFNDMYWFPQETAAVVQNIGIRAVIGMILIHFPSAYAKSEQEYIDKGHQVMEAFKQNKHIHFAYSPHAPYTVPDETLVKLGKLSQENNIPLHIHLHETSDECDQSLALNKESPSCHMSPNACRPVENFQKLGLLNNRLCAAHMVHLTEDEIRQCAEHRVNIVHCPSSNMKLSSGFCPVAKLAQAGVNVAIGTDGASSNNTLDMLAEMKTAALLAKNVAGDPRVIPAPVALQMATLNGAKAIGLEKKIGSIVVGKSADLCALELGTKPRTTPVFCPVSTLVYSASRDDVTDVWVAGRRLLMHGMLTTIQDDSLTHRCNEWRTKILELLASKN